MLVRLPLALIDSQRPQVRWGSCDLGEDYRLVRFVQDRQTQAFTGGRRDTTDIAELLDRGGRLNVRVCLLLHLGGYMVKRLATAISDFPETLVLSHLSIMRQVLGPYKPSLTTPLSRCLTAFRKPLIEAILKSYANLNEGCRTLVLHLHAANLARIPLLRTVFPHSPFGLVLDEPESVARCMLTDPPSWLNLKLEENMSHLLRDAPVDRIAKSIGRFYVRILETMDDQCVLINGELSECDALGRLSSHFGFPIEPRGLGPRRKPGQLSGAARGSSSLVTSSELRIALNFALDQWAALPYRDLLRSVGEDGLLVKRGESLS